MATGMSFFVFGLVSGSVIFCCEMYDKIHSTRLVHLDDIKFFDIIFEALEH